MRFIKRTLFFGTIILVLAGLVYGAIQAALLPPAYSGPQTLGGVQFEYFDEIIPPDKLVVIETIFTLGCSACRQQLISFKDIDIEGVQIIAINVGDSKRQVKEFADANNLEYIIIVNTEDIIEKEKIEAFPITSFLVRNSGGWERLGSKIGYIGSDELLMLATTLLQEATK